MTPRISALREAMKEAVKHLKAVNYGKALSVLTEALVEDDENGETNGGPKT